MSNEVHSFNLKILLDSQLSMIIGQVCRSKGNHPSSILHEALMVNLALTITVPSGEILVYSWSVKRLCPFDSLSFRMKESARHIF